MVKKERGENKKTANQKAFDELPILAMLARDFFVDDANAMRYVARTAVVDKVERRSFLLMEALQNAEQSRARRI
eukprot:g6318.t1